MYKTWKVLASDYELGQKNYKGLNIRELWKIFGHFNYRFKCHKCCNNTFKFINNKITL